MMFIWSWMKFLCFFFLHLLHDNRGKNSRLYNLFTLLAALNCRSSSSSSSSSSRPAVSKDSLNSQAICHNQPSLLVSSLDSVQCWCRAYECKFLLTDQHLCLDVYESNVMNEFTFTPPVAPPATLAHLIWMVTVIRVGKRQYSCYFVRCCFKDFFKTACSGTTIQ